MQLATTDPTVSPNPTSILPLNPAYHLPDEPILWLLALGALAAVGLFVYHSNRCYKLDGEFDPNANSVRIHYSIQQLKKHALFAVANAGMVVIFGMDALFDRTRQQPIDITWSIRTYAVLTVIAAVLSVGVIIKRAQRAGKKAALDLGVIIPTLNVLVCTLAATDLLWVWSKPYAIHPLRPWFDIENTLFWVIEVVLCWTLGCAGSILGRYVVRHFAVRNNRWAKARS